MKKLFYSIVAMASIALVIFIAGCDTRFTVTFIDYDGTVIAIESVRENRKVNPPRDPFREDYTFIGWDKEIENINNDIEVHAIYVPKKVQVTFKDYNQMIFKVDIINYGSNATPPSDAIREGYTFIGWDQELENIKTNIVVNAMYIKNICQVTFLDYHKEIIKEEFIHYGDVVSPPEVEEIFGLEFVGWSEDLTKITDNIIVEPIYIRKTYQVVFQDYNKMIFSYQQVTHGSNAISPQDPYREGYTFKDWDTSFFNVTEDLLIKPRYDINKYIVIFNDENGNLLKDEIVEYGNNATPPLLSKEGYNYYGWNGEYQNVKSDLVLSPIFDVNRYLVTFVDDNSFIIKTEMVYHGSNATPPDNINKEGYEFINWDKDYNHITSDLVIKANYQINTYLVSFIDDNDILIDSVYVNHGSDAIINNPTKVGHKFIGWSADIRNVKSNLEVKAEYEINVYQVIFRDYNNLILRLETIEHGKGANPPMVSREGYEFLNWDKTITNITTNLDVKAVYKIKEFTVIFYDHNNNFLKSELVNYNDNATPPNLAPRIGYNFAGWSASYNNIKENKEIKAIYDIKTYQVTFKDDLGLIYKIETVNHGNDATPPIPIVKEGHTFIGWNQDYQNITSDLELNALYNKNLYTIFFDTNGGNVIDEFINVEYNSTVNLPIPKKLGYDFIGWYISNELNDNNFTDKSLVTNDLTLYARWRLVYLKYFVEDNQVNIIGYNGDVTDIIIPEYIENYRVTIISANAFKDNSDITRIILPSSINKIGDNAFRNMVSLETIEISNVNCLFGNNVLTDTSNLKEITITSHIKLNRLFGDTSINIPLSLKTVNIVHGSNYICDGFLKGATNIMSLNIPSTIHHLGKNLIEDTNIQSIDLTLTSLTEINDYAFNKAASLESITLPNTVIRIGSYAFANSSIIDIELPDSVSIIGRGAFKEAQELISITIPNRVTHIDYEVFRFATKLVSVNLSSNLTYIGEFAFADTTSLVTINLPNSLMTIAENAFLNARSIKDLILPSNLKSIGANAFSGLTSLVSVVIPASVDRIDSNAFKNCSSLEFVRFERTQYINHMNIGLTVFPTNSVFVYIYVPEISLSDYRLIANLNEVYNFFVY